MYIHKNKSVPLYIYAIIPALTGGDNKYIDYIV